MRRLIFAATCLALVAPRAAFADNTADEADLRFQRGVEAYRAKKYDDALAEFFQSNRLVRNLNVVHNIARCYEQLKMYDEAYRYYLEVYSESPKGEDQRALEESLARIAPRVALLQVSSTPPGADVFIERKDLGSLGLSPRTLALKPGKTTVILSLAGHREAKKVVSLSVGHKASVDLSLEYIWAKVKLEGTPAGAQVRVDKTEGPPEASLPGTLKVKPGKHILNISAPGHVSTQVPVDVLGDQEAQAKVDLQPLPPPTGNVVVIANHDGALVKIDGKESGFTPAVISLVEGAHQVAVAMADMRTFEQEVKVVANTTQQVKAELRFAGAKTTAASKEETAVEDAPASITVITREELRAFGYQTVVEALQSVRGFFAYNDREYETLGVRGFSPTGDTNNRVLMLWDGHAIIDQVSGSGFLARDMDVNLDELDRIEIVRGPVSSLYGTNAFFGVINLVPRHSLGDHLVEGTVAAGSLSQFGGRVTGSVHGGWGEVLVTGAAVRVGGDNPFMLSGSAGDMAIRNADAELAFHGTVRARYKELTLFVDLNSRAKQLPTGGAYSDPERPGTRVLDQRLEAEARWEHKFEGGAALTARLYFDATHYDGIWMNFDSPDQKDFTEGEWGGLEVRFRVPEFLRQHLTVGIEAQEQFRLWQAVDTVGSSRIENTHDLTILSAYVSDDARLHERLIVNASVRADEYVGTKFNITVNPRLAIIGKLWPGGVTKLMGGSSFRAASAYERFYNDGYPDPNDPTKTIYVTAAPNPDLNPETIWTAELEHSQEIGQDFKVAAAIYVNFISNLIISVPYSALLQPDVSMSGNAQGLVRTQGAELELRWQPARLAMISASYAFQQMFITGGVGDDAASLRSNMPAHTFAIKGMFPISAPLLIGAAEVVYNSARPMIAGGTTGEMLLLNVGLSGELTGGNLRYFAGVRNLLDQRAQMPAGGGYAYAQATIPTYGRTFLIQLTGSY